MKNLITVLFCIVFISTNAIAQRNVRIGNLEISVRNNNQDTTMQVVVTDPCPPCPSENEVRPKPKTIKNKYYSTFFGGLGFILPDNGNSYYTVLGGNSINIDAGWMHRYHICPWFALGSTLQYSYYNYKLRDAANEPAFMEEVLGKPFAKEDINKQAYRCHNISASAFTRFYLVPPKRKNDGIYIDLGIQGDFSFSKYLKFHTNSEGKDRYHDDYAFNSFSASAITRLGWKDYAIFTRYRITDAFNSKALLMDLPPITIGIQFF